MTRQRYVHLRVSGLTVLCVGARGGGEVRAFRLLGSFAVGTDIFPTDGGELVLKGSAHSLQFANASADVIFSNVLDHTPDLSAFVSEAARVLKPGGRLITEVYLQMISHDEWAVRDTGMQEFYSTMHAAMRATGVMSLASRCDSPGRAAWERNMMARVQQPDEVIWRKT